jgi:hypothetical protein
LNGGTVEVVVVVDGDEVEDEEEIDEVEDEVPGGLGGIHMTAPRAKVHMSVTTTAAAGIDIPALLEGTHFTLLV